MRFEMGHARRCQGATTNSDEDEGEDGKLRETATGRWVWLNKVTVVEPGDAFGGSLAWCWDWLLSIIWRSYTRIAVWDPEDCETVRDIVYEEKYICLTNCLWRGDWPVLLHHRKVDSETSRSGFKLSAVHFFGHLKATSTNERRLGGLPFFKLPPYQHYPQLRVHLSRCSIQVWIGWDQDASQAWIILSQVRPSPFLYTCVPSNIPFPPAHLKQSSSIFSHPPVSFLSPHPPFPQPVTLEYCTSFYGRNDDLKLRMHIVLAGWEAGWTKPVWGLTAWAFFLCLVLNWG